MALIFECNVVGYYFEMLAGSIKKAVQRGLRTKASEERARAPEIYHQTGTRENKLRMSGLGDSGHTGGYICEECVGWWVFVPELEAGVVIGVSTILRASLEFYRSNALHPETIFLVRTGFKAKGKR